MSKKPVNTDAGQKQLNGFPDKCPHCHKSITANILFGHRNENVMEVFFSCPDFSCNKSFIGYYYYADNASYLGYQNKTSIGNLQTRHFSEKILEISKQFDVIYNQAYSAEQEGLFEICGVGYRKALEFLIKDYAILNQSQDNEKIEKQFLAKTIEEYVNDSRVKSVSKRAVWLGNDETHYIRKWEGKNLEDLKKLIDLTVHWIEMEALTKSFSEDMPD